MRFNMVHQFDDNDRILYSNCLQQPQQQQQQQQQQRMQVFASGAAGAGSRPSVSQYFGYSAGNNSGSTSPLRQPQQYLQADIAPSHHHIQQQQQYYTTDYNGGPAGPNNPVECMSGPGPGWGVYSHGPDASAASPDWTTAAGATTVGSRYAGYRGEEPLDVLHQPQQLNPDRSPHQPGSAAAVGAGIAAAPYTYRSLQSVGGELNVGKYQDDAPTTGSHVTSAVKRQLIQSPSTDSSRSHHDGLVSAGAGGGGAGSWGHSQQAPFDWMKKQTYPAITPSGKTRTKDKYRIVYSELQKVELEKEFLYNQYITIQRKAELATSIGLSDRQVKIWFQNRRAKERKTKRKSSSDDSSRSGHGPVGGASGAAGGAKNDGGAASRLGMRQQIQQQQQTHHHHHQPHHSQQQLLQQQQRCADVIKMETVGHAHDLMTSSMSHAANIYSMN